MFLGEGGSGKSSLLDGLMNIKFKENKPSTLLADARSIMYKFVETAETAKGAWKELTEEEEVNELAKLSHSVVKSVVSNSNNEELPQAEEVFAMTPPMTPPTSSQVESHSKFAPGIESSSRIEEQPEEFAVETPTSSQVESHSKLTAEAPGTECEYRSSNNEELPQEMVVESDSDDSSSSSINEIAVAVPFLKEDSQVVVVEASQFQKELCIEVAHKAKQLEEYMSSNSNVLHVWDCGGQPVFLDILSAFLTARTMFLLLFDASVPLNDIRKVSVWRFKGYEIVEKRRNSSNKLLLIRWMHLIYASLVAPQQKETSPFPRIMMVGSRGDKITESEKKGVSNSLQEACTDTRFNNIVLDRLIIDNNTAGMGEQEDEGYGRIRETVHRFAKSLTLDTPLAWISFRNVLRKSVAEMRKEKPILSYPEVVAVAESCNIAEDSVKSVLRFYHELGVFLYYANIDSLSKTVFVEPQWLFKQLCKLLISKRDHATDLHVIPMSFWDDLEKYGILRSDYCQVISCDCGLEPDALVELLDYFDLAKEIMNCPKHLDHIECKKYFMPCMLNMQPHESKLIGSVATLHMVFNMDYVPPGFFVRLAVQMASSTKFKLLFRALGGLYHDCITFRYGEFDKVTISEPSSLRSVHVDVVRDAMCTDSCPLRANSLSNELYEMSVKVLCWLPSIELDFAFKCNSHNGDQEHFVKLDMIQRTTHDLSSEELPMYVHCGDCDECLEITERYKYWLPQVCIGVETDCMYVQYVRVYLSLLTIGMVLCFKCMCCHSFPRMIQLIPNLQAPL